MINIDFLSPLGKSVTRRVAEGWKVCPKATNKRWGSQTVCVVKQLSNGKTMSLGDVLAIAIRSHREGKLAEAEAIYRAILQSVPGQPDACHYLGVLLHQRGQSEEGIKHIRQAIQTNPDYGDAWNNLGNVYKETGEAEKAVEAYRAVLRLMPDHAGALNNLGVVLKELEAHDEAIVALQQAIALEPNRGDFHQNLGNAYRKQGDITRAAEAFRRSIALQPYQADAYRNLWQTLYSAREYEAAGNVLRQWLEFDPDNPIARHTYAAHMGGRQIPHRASDAYVKQTFDGFAGSFDNVLARLDYRAPALVAEAVDKAIGPATGHLIVLDAGCGTGLCGPMLRSHARTLIGVDLSPKMLAKAEGRKVYEELIETELVGYLEQNPRRFDLIVSADTLVYFGDLGPFSHAARNALLPNGHLIFTVEKQLEDQDFGLGMHGRYLHAQSYVANCLASARFASVSMEDVILRKEDGEPVNGLLVTARNGL
jgi:predicted TPR repeat methyltransferase